MIDNHQKSSFILRLLKLCNGILITIPFLLTWEYFYSTRIYGEFYSLGNWIMIGLFAVLYMLFAHVYEAYDIPYSSQLEIFYSELLALFVTNGIIYVVIILLSRHWPNILPLLGSLLISSVIAYIWSRITTSWFNRNRIPKKTIILFDEAYKTELVANEVESMQRFEILATYHVEDIIDNRLSILDEADTVFLCGIHSHDRNIILKYCFMNDVETFVFPRIGDVLMHSLQPIHLFHLPVWRGRRYAPHFEFLFIKRCFDILSSGLVLLLASPIMLVVAYLIHKEDGGPVFYKQTRLTKDGKTFDVLKFRSMRVDAEKDGVARLSTGANDNRVTPIGQFIRKCRIDELPQLIKIIKGDMSVVGPRPERPEIAKVYEESLPEFSLRLQAKAGLTGLAQVYGKYNTSPYDKLQMDLAYIAKPSVLEDLRIIFATFKILFKAESTEGVKENQRNAAR